ncbi:MAG: LPS assembly lipoprotein LptE [Pseudomonadota bacterium]
MSLRKLHGMQATKPRRSHRLDGDIRGSRMRIGFIVAAMGAVSLIVSACSSVQPLYATDGTTSVAGQAYSGAVGTELSQIDIPPQNDRVGQRLRNELLFRLSGGANPSGPAYAAYNLELRTRQRDLAQLISEVEGRPTSNSVSLQVSYTLKRPGSDDVVTRGTVERVATYDTTDQRFAAERAKIDAENRAVVEAADSIRTELATYFATGGR